MALVCCGRWVSVLAVGGTLLLGSRAAEASSCFPSVSIAWPSDGGELPQGAQVLVDTFCLFGDEVSYEATVDGEPAELSEGDVEGTYRIVPSPSVGANVVFGACVDEHSGQPSCDSVSLTVVATEEDRSFVAPSLDLHHDLRWSWIDMRWYWGLRAEIGGQEENAGRPALYRVGLDNGERSSDLTISDGAEDTSTQFGASILPPPGTQVCVTVVGSDAFGSTAQPVTQCTTVEAEPEHSCLNEGDDPDSCIEDTSGCSVGPRSDGWQGLILLGLAGLRRRKRA